MGRRGRLKRGGMDLQALLDAAVSQGAAPGLTAAVDRAAPKASTGFDDMDDDIPF